MKNVKFETVAGLFVAIVVLSALTGLAGSALKAIGVDSENVGLADALTGLATLVVAVLGWFAARRNAADAAAAEERARRPVRFFLVAGEVRRELPLHLRARDCSRPETFGRIGSLPMSDPGKRFSLAALARGEFLEALNAVQDGTKDVVEIPASENEVDQFAWDKIN